jgi:hypothetical protein
MDCKLELLQMTSFTRQGAMKTEKYIFASMVKSIGDK